jgi:hypothetical protein
MRAVISGVTAGVLIASVATAPLAQPTQAPDLAHAKELYATANQAMTEGRFDDAARDFGGAYDLTHDPILFFKIGLANEKAGHCDTAQIYFDRYLKEAKPDRKFQQLAQDHIRACGGDARDVIPATTEPETDLTGSGSDTGSAAALPPPPAPAPPAPAPTPVPAPLPPPPPPLAPPGNDAAWLMVGGGLAFVTIGAVLAYSASSSEQDLKDLYVGLDGNPPVYDATVAKRYQSLVDEGQRYEHLSWAAFGVAGGFAVAATILFLHGHHDGRVEPTPTGVAIKF